GELGRWVRYQRDYHRENKLDQAKVDRLRGIGFLFAGDARAAWREATGEAWETRFGELEQYRNEHGHCNVPKGQGELGRWVQHQRYVFKRGRLDQTRIDRLRSIDFEWSLYGDATVRTDHLSVADSINDEFTGDEDVEEVRAVQGMNDGEPLVPQLLPMRMMDVLDGDRDWGWA
ncbi:hypothetical protein THAOC_24831, partial [Thalassiosira oceanica]